MTVPELFPADPRCHLCGLVCPPDDLHWDHDPDCVRGSVCRCDLDVCAGCCTDEACVGARVHLLDHDNDRHRYAVCGAREHTHADQRLNFTIDPADVVCAGCAQLAARPVVDTVPL